MFSNTLCYKSLKDMCYKWSPKPVVFYIWPDIFTNRPCLKNLRGISLQRIPRCKKCPDIWKVICSGRAKIMHQVTFTISPLPRGYTFRVWLHVFHLWTSCQKNAPEIFGMSYINKFQWNLASCIEDILNVWMCLNWNHHPTIRISPISNSGVPADPSAVSA